MWILLTGAALSATGAEWLERIDAAAVRSETLVVEMDLLVGDAERQLTVWQKGDKRLVRLTAPPRLAGTALLSDGEALHRHLPAYDQTRRVVGEARGDAFVGTDFTMEDLARVRFADTYSAAVLEEGSGARLALTPSGDAEPALVIEVGEDHLVRRVEHADGRVVVFDDFREQGGHTYAWRVEVVDPARDRRTVATVRSLRLDEELDDARFTVTELRR